MFQTLCFFFLLNSNFLRNFLFFNLITTFLYSEHSFVKGWLTSLKFLLFNIFVIWLYTMIFCWSFIGYFSIKLIPKNIFFHCMSRNNSIMLMIFVNKPRTGWVLPPNIFWSCRFEVVLPANKKLRTPTFQFSLQFCNNSMVQWFVQWWGGWDPQTNSLMPFL